MDEFEGKVAVVTGAASGIGRALVAAFAGRGMKVVMADIESEALEKAAQEMRGTGADVFAVTADVSTGRRRRAHRRRRDRCLRGAARCLQQRRSGGRGTDVGDR